MTINVDEIIQPVSGYISRPSTHEPILEPYNYLAEIPGNNQNVRTKFIQAFNELYYKINDPELLEQISEIISIFHNSSLLIDDIEDSSQYRRGLTCAHIKFGTPLTLNCGNLMYFIALQKAQHIPNKILQDKHEIDQLKFKTSQVLIDEMLNLHHGQGLDIYWRDYLTKIETLPEIEDYLYMIKDKTAGLFRLSIKLLGLYSTEQVNFDLIPIANLLGIIYQIRDDYLNLIDDKYSAMKGIAGEDLIEGKLSLPILHCLRNTTNSPVYKLLYEYPTSEARKNQPELIEQSIRYMTVESKSLQFTLELIHDLETKVKQLLLLHTPQAQDSLLFQIINHLCDI
ncbi:Geranylgeranyl pyrophosphate synthase [Spathaspora sp. JA1]|nr:Geranylgeranyl pyrophosphate synthase [Spathaspora sp. JA1]